MNIGEYLQSRPLLRIGIMMMLGIAVGRMADIPFSCQCIAATMFALLCLAALLRRANIVPSLLIMAAALLLGMFLITRSDRSTVSHSVPYMERVGEWMQQRRAMLLETCRDKGINGDEYAVVAAMTLGERGAVNDSLRRTYDISGAAHVFALSGLHIGIIYMILGLLLPKRRYKPFTVTVKVTLLWMFVLLVGFHASILRAAIMTSVYSVVSAFSRKTDTMDVLVMTAVLLLVFMPEWLFDVGFQMSFLAVASIILIYRPINVCMPEEMPWALRYFVGMILVTLAANIGVMPLIAHYFGMMSVYFIFSGIVISPCAFLIIMLAVCLFFFIAVAAMLPFFSPIADGAAWLLNHVLSLQNHYLTWVASLPYASIEGVHINAKQTAVIYVLITAVCYLTYLFFKNRKRY